MGDLEFRETRNKYIYKNKLGILAINFFLLDNYSVTFPTLLTTCFNAFFRRPKGQLVQE